MIELWQACASGRYNHPRDTNRAALDTNFQYWAQVRTDSGGNFSVKTIKPGAYPASPTWIRPPHIHIKVHKADIHRSQRRFTSQVIGTMIPIIFSKP